MSRKPRPPADAPPRGVVDAPAAERAIVGALLADPGSTGRALAELGLEAGDFPRFGSVVTAVRRIVERAEPVDVATVAAELTACGALTGLGGISVLLELSEALPDPRPGAVEFYARRLREAALVRRVKGLAGDFDGDLGAVGDLEGVLAELRAVRDGEVGRRSVLADCWPSEPDASPYLSPPVPRSWLLTSPSGQGVLPRGKAGLLAAEGGAGKTHSLLALAVGLVTGRPLFGCLEVPAYVNGRCLLLLGEEDQEEIGRRLWAIAEALALSEAERRRCAERVVCLGLAGHNVGLTAFSNGTLTETPLVGDLRYRLEREAGLSGWALVGLDPLSRFGGGDLDVSSEHATRLVEIAEALTRAPGNPSVLMAAHSSKMARRAGSVDVRGASALSDGFRWVGTLTKKGEQVAFSVMKSNYTLPVEPLTLVWDNGVLRVVTPSEQAQATTTADGQAQAELEADVARVVEVLCREGAMTSRDGIAHTAGLRLVRGRAALDLAVSRGLAVRDGTDRRPTYRPAVPGCGVRVPPRTPPDGRDGDGKPRPPVGVPSRDGLGRVGRAEAEDNYRPPVEPF